MIKVEHAALAPYFQVATSAVAGVFAVEGEDLYYGSGGARVHVVQGARPRALAAGSKGVMVTGGDKLFWFSPETAQLHEIPDVPPGNQVAAHGDTYLIAANKQVFKWTPDTAPVQLSEPDHLFAVYGVSLSPDGRYGVVAYDLDIPGGPRATVVWAYDLKDGTILKWPAEQPKVMDGRWLLGWSEPNTIRFMTGVRGSPTAGRLTRSFCKPCIQEANP